MKRIIAIILSITVSVMMGSVFVSASDEGGIDNPDINIGAEIEDVDAETISTVGDAVNYIKERL